MLSVAVTHTGLPAGLLHRLHLPRLHYRPRQGHPGSGGRPSPPRRDRDRHPGSQVRRRPQPPPLGPFSRQRRLAGRTSHCPLSGTLDHAHRFGRAGDDHQDPQATFLLPGRTAHPQGTPPHPTSPPGLALAKPVQSGPRTIARTAAPLLTPPLAFDLSTMTPYAWTISPQAGRRTVSAGD